MKEALDSNKGWKQTNKNNKSLLPGREGGGGVEVTFSHYCTGTGGLVRSAKGVQRREGEPEQSKGHTRLVSECGPGEGGLQGLEGQPCSLGARSQPP